MGVCVFPIKHRLAKIFLPLLTALSALTLLVGRFSWKRGHKTAVAEVVVVVLIPEEILK